MKLVEYKDDQGRIRRALLKDDDPPELAEQGRGVPQDPPDLEQIDWQAVATDLHNELVVRGLLNFEDVQRQQNGLGAAIRAVLLPRLTRLYRR
jgi:hypothetical protein